MWWCCAIYHRYRYLRDSPSDEELKSKDDEVNPWQLELSDICTILQMARLTIRNPDRMPYIGPILRELQIIQYYGNTYA